MRRLVITVVALIALAVAGVAGAAAASLPGAAADGCYDNKTGVVRVDVDGHGCRSKETPISIGAPLATRRVVAGATAPAGDYNQAVAECPVGQVVLGGGYETATIHPDVRPFTNAPMEINGRQGWYVTVINESGVDIEFSAFAICAPGTATGF